MHFALPKLWKLPVDPE